MSFKTFFIPKNGTLLFKIFKINVLIFRNCLHNYTTLTAEQEDGRHGPNGPPAPDPAMVVSPIK